MRGADNDCHWISWSEVTVSELHVDLSRPQSSSVVTRRACRLYRKALSHAGGDVHPPKPQVSRFGLLIFACNR